jgi:ankyrin repeat protein
VLAASHGVGATVLDLVAAAVAKGCNVNKTDWKENSCLHLAAEQGSVDILPILLKAGADVAAKNKDRKTPLDTAKKEEVKAALREHGAKNSLFQGYFTPYEAV